jgi:hypothetical protein
LQWKNLIFPPHWSWTQPVKTQPEWKNLSFDAYHLCFIMYCMHKYVNKSYCPRLVAATCRLWGESWNPLAFWNLSANIVLGQFQNSLRSEDVVQCFH